MNTLLFTIGIAVFMLTVYGTVMAGGAALKQRQVDDLADDIAFAVNEDGWEVLSGASAARSTESRIHRR